MITLKEKVSKVQSFAGRNFCKRLLSNLIFANGEVQIQRVLTFANFKYIQKYCGYELQK